MTRENLIGVIILAGLICIAGISIVNAQDSVAPPPAVEGGAEGEEEENTYPTQECVEVFSRYSMHEMLLASAYYFLNWYEPEQRALKYAIRDKYLLGDLGNDTHCLYGG